MLVILQYTLRLRKILLVYALVLWIVPSILPIITMRPVTVVAVNENGERVDIIVESVGCSPSQCTANYTKKASIHELMVPSDSIVEFVKFKVADSDLPSRLYRPSVPNSPAQTAIVIPVNRGFLSVRNVRQSVLRLTGLQCKVLRGPAMVRLVPLNENRYYSSMLSNCTIPVDGLGRGRYVALFEDSAMGRYSAEVFLDPQFRDSEISSLVRIN